MHNNVPTQDTYLSTNIKTIWPIETLVSTHTLEFHDDEEFKKFENKDRFVRIRKYPKVAVCDVYYFMIETSKPRQYWSGRPNSMQIVIPGGATKSVIKCPKIKYTIVIPIDIVHTSFRPTNTNIIENHLYEYDAVQQTIHDVFYYPYEAPTYAMAPRRQIFPRATLTPNVNVRVGRDYIPQLLVPAYIPTPTQTLNQYLMTHPENNISVVARRGKKHRRQNIKN